MAKEFILGISHNNRYMVIKYFYRLEIISDTLWKAGPSAHGELVTQLLARIVLSESWISLLLRVTRIPNVVYAGVRGKD